MPVVVVESPAKAKTINKYLGDDYTVLASYGHVRDLPPKDGSVLPDQDFRMEWEVDARSQKHVRAIAEAVKADGALILATDPDREGEAISWHLLEALRKRKVLKKDAPVSRVVFNAITKSAVTEAMAAPRAIDQELVDAYLARRALDYLVGFTLSPVLWRKLPGAKSAGRVQSVALRLIVEREMEIEAFKRREYWTLRAEHSTPRGERFVTRLVTLEGKKLDRFDLPDREAAQRALDAVSAARFTVAAVEAKPATRNPSPPFMTSTLQQEASRKLGLGAKAAMSTAQRLYEAGYITYMRTDGLDMAPEAVSAARAVIGERYGAAFVPEKPRVYKTKAKNAQEAHECIRPTDFSRSPDTVEKLESDQRRLYELIWKRSVASQMEAARLERTTVDVLSDDKRTGLRATGQVVKFEGFLKVYEEGRDDDGGEESARLPEIRQGEAAPLLPFSKSGLTAEAAKLEAREETVTDEAMGYLTADVAALAAQSFTQPPPRYTEATLVKRMEELGIGRPSTYASIIDTIQTREYVRKDKNRLIAEDKGRLVIAFLENYFRRYVEYDFTAALEEELDEVSGGRADWKEVLRNFWKNFSSAIDDTKELRISDVLDKINDALGPHLFPEREDGANPRACPLCEDGQLSLKTGKFGAFIGCANYPNCKYTRPLGGEQEGPADAAGDGKLLGHNDAGRPVTLKLGRFGPYVELGVVEESGEKPKRASVPKGFPAETVDLEKALDLLKLPRDVGPHPEDGEMVVAGIGRFGPYVKHGKTYASIPKDEDVLTIGMNRAVDLIAQKRANPGRRGQAAAPLRTLGAHPDGGDVTVHEGRYGPYVKWEKVNATLPDTLDKDKVTLEEALPLIAAKAPKKKAPARKKAPAKKAASKAKAPAKKAAARKKTARPAEPTAEE